MNLETKAGAAARAFPGEVVGGGGSGAPRAGRPGRRPSRGHPTGSGWCSAGRLSVFAAAEAPDWRGEVSRTHCIIKWLLSLATKFRVVYGLAVDNQNTH